MLPKMSHQICIFTSFVVLMGSEIWFKPLLHLYSSSNNLLLFSFVRWLLKFSKVGEKMDWKGLYWGPFFLTPCRTKFLHTINEIYILSIVFNSFLWHNFQAVCINNWQWSWMVGHHSNKIRDIRLNYCRFEAQWAENECQALIEKPKRW